MKALVLDNPFRTLLNNPEIYYLDETDSTMNQARELLKTSPATGTVVVANFQHSGRGRGNGRRWLSAPGESLLFSLLIRKEEFHFSLSLFPLLTGLGISKFCETLGLETKIKWPNDILWEGKKLAGILCEATGEYLITGIGLNCLQKEFPPGHRREPVSLFLAGGMQAAPLQHLSSLLQHLSEAYRNSKWMEAVEKRLYGFGKKIIFSPGLPEGVSREQGRKEENFVEGVIAGLGESGELLVSCSPEDSPIPLISGEIRSFQGDKQ